MHIPDGFLSPKVWGAMDALAMPSVVYLARRAQREFQHHQIPLMGVMGAFIFAAQMINFPVGNGTSGHLVGSALLAYTLGPAAASIVMTAILATQALVFQDGGLLALGANVFNMAIAGVLAGYLPYVAFRGSKAGIFLGGLCSVLLSALLALAELIFSGVAMPSGILAVSIGLFIVSGVIEGAITMLVAGALARFQQNVPAGNGNDDRAIASFGVSAGPATLLSRTLAFLVLASVFLAVVGILFASTHPDGLAKVAEQVGISGRATSIISSPLADYKLHLGGRNFPGAANVSPGAANLSYDWLNRALAGLAGLGVVYVVCLLAARLIAAARPALGGKEA